MKATELVRKLLDEILDNEWHHPIGGNQDSYCNHCYKTKSHSQTNRHESKCAWEKLVEDADKFLTKHK